MGWCAFASARGARCASNSLRMSSRLPGCARPLTMTASLDTPGTLGESWDACNPSEDGFSYAWTSRLDNTHETLRRRLLLQGRFEYQQATAGEPHRLAAPAGRLRRRA